MALEVPMGTQETVLQQRGPVSPIFQVFVLRYDIARPLSFLGC